MEELYYPLQVSFTINGNIYSQAVLYDEQEIEILESMFTISTDDDTNVLVEITEAVDNLNGGIQLSNSKLHTRTIFAKPEIVFITSMPKIAQGDAFTHLVEMTSGNESSATYNWFVDPPEGTSTDLSVINGNLANIVWDGPLGVYSIKVAANDGNGCLSDTIIQQIEIVKHDDLIVYAGNDTTVSSCTPYQLQAAVSDTTGLTYLWQPSENLDDPTILNPVFTPGSTTTFVLTVTTANGTALKDTVEITVSDIYANAGDDVLIEEGASAMLDGTASVGESVQYLWTTNNGFIDSGENTANPIISSPGTYYLEIADLYACVATDSVEVSLVTYAPVANDDYDTTNFQTAVSIPVLANDYDPAGDLDTTSLSIVQYPLNASVYINYNDYSISYTPADGFVGSDVFEYQICNLAALCDNAYVYVFVVPVDFFIPEAFTPNGDNVNDYFEIEGIQNYEGNSLTVLNRWGKKVYVAQNYGIATSPRFWDGKWTTGGGNEDLPTGTYFYVFDLGNGQKPIAGTVYIDR